MRQRTIVGCLIAFYLLGAFLWQGISFNDDALYLREGLQFKPSLFGWALEWGPLYAMWIKGVSLVVHDRIWCYLVSWALMVLVILRVPLLARMRWAWVYTLSLVCLPFLGTSPYITLFGAMFLVTGLCLVLRYGLPISSAVCLACLLSFFVALARPEYRYGVFAAAAGTVIAVIVERPRGTPRVAWAKVFCVLAASGALLFLINHSPKTRSGMAFAQHFNLRASRTGLLGGEDPWTSNYTERTFHIDVEHGANETRANISDFYHANPRMFAGHLVANVFEPRATLTIGTILFLAALPWVLPRYRELRPASVYLCLVTFPSVASMLLIFPRPHYLVTIAPVLVAMAAQVLSQQVRLDPPAVWRVLVPGAVVVGMLAFYRIHHSPDFDTVQRSNIAIVRCVNELEGSQGAGNGKMLDTATTAYSDGYFNIPRTRVFVTGAPGVGTLNGLLQRERPSWILAGPNMAMTYGETREAFSGRLEKDFGYAAHVCPKTDGVMVYTLPGQ